MRNRVTPMGDIVAIPLRGAWLGNRGILHEGTEIRRLHGSDLWITCQLRFRDRHVQQWQPRHYTHLYFYDEAVSFAAGHRPCGECRRADYNAYRAAWATGLEVAAPSATQMNRQLHAERLVPRTQRRRLHRRPWRSLPTGAFVLMNSEPTLVCEGAVLAWTTSGYAAPRSRPGHGDVDVITPPASLAALTAGYPVQIDHAAGVTGIADPAAPDPTAGAPKRRRPT